MSPGMFFQAMLMLSLVTVCFSKVPSPFPYQAHSFNDLDVAIHLLRRGVKYFKFDASLANKESCLKYSSWAASPCINLPEYAEDMCCIAMRGDASSEPNFNYPFNTSHQFTALLDEFLESNDTDILFVAIDFQFSFSFSNTLAENFMHELAFLMDKYPRLHVTTKGEYIFQYDRVCRYNSENTFVPSNLQNLECSPSRKYISESRFFLQSGSTTYPYDSRDYKKRYRNFNTIFREIDHLCEHGFPSWPNAYPDFPLIFWEPSNQLQIQESLNKLMSPQCRKKHNRTLSGIAFASNIDPEMFDLAMRPTKYLPSLESWFLQETKVFLGNVTKMKLAKVQLGFQEEGLVVYRKIQIKTTIQHVLSIHKFNSLTAEVTINQEVQELIGVADKFVVIARNSPQGQARQFSASLTSYDADLDVCSSLKVSNFITASSFGSTFFYLTLSSNPDVVITFRSDSCLQHPSQYLLPVLMPSTKVQTITRMHISQNSEGKIVQLLLGNDGKKTWISQIRDTQVHSESTLSFGINARVLESPHKQLMIFMEDSYTHGGLLMNNNGQNTCLYHRYPKLEPLASIPGLINAIEVSLSDLLTFIENNTSDDVVTACHPKMILAKYLNGHNFEAVYLWNRIIISAQYIPISKQDFVTAVFSGGSNFNRELRNKQGFLLASTSQRKQSISESPVYVVNK